MNGLARIPTA
jgi:hypothetical protein